MSVLTAIRPVAVPVAPVLRRRSRRLRSRFGSLTASTLLLAFTALTLVPIWIMITVSLRNGSDVADSFSFPSNPQWQNYADAFTNMHYLRSVANTLIITVSTAVLTIITSSMAAWAIVRYTRAWTRTAYQVFVAGLTIPIFVVLTPLYQVLQQLHLLDSFPGLVLAYTGMTMPFAVFFFAGFLRAVPAELEEAAAVDGCGLLRTYWSIVLPLLKPATATLSIFIILQVWNDLILPLVLLSSDTKQTVTLSVYATIGTHSFSPAQMLPTLVQAKHHA